MEILFFTGNYCPSCKAMYPIINDLSNKYVERVRFININVEQDQEITLQHKITSIPALIFIKEGQGIERLIGPQIKSQLIKRIDSHL